MIPVGTPHSHFQPDGRATRRESFVAVAREAFFNYGYAGTTMSSIAATVGGSKTTLWSYFPSKEDLFAAVVDDIVEQYGQALMIKLDANAPVQETLHRFARALMDATLSAPIIDLHRVVTGEAGRFPALGKLFYERGPRRGKARLAQYFAVAMADGRLRPGDPRTAARQFSALCQAGRFQEAVLGVDGDAGRSVEQDIDAAVDSFMRAWSKS